MWHLYTSYSSKDPSNRNGGRSTNLLVYVTGTWVTECFWSQASSIWEDLNMLTQKSWRRAMLECRQHLASIFSKFRSHGEGTLNKPELARRTPREERKSPTLIQGSGFMKHQVRWSDNTPCLTVRNYFQGQRTTIPLYYPEGVYQTPFCKALRRSYRDL